MRLERFMTSFSEFFIQGLKKLVPVSVVPKLFVDFGYKVLVGDGGKM